MLLAFSGSMSGELTDHAARPDRQLRTTFRSTAAACIALAAEARAARCSRRSRSRSLLLVLAAIAGNMIQHRLVWSAEALKPKLSKISPLAGFKRLFSKQALANFVKGLVKLAVVGAVMTVLLWPERDGSTAWSTIDPAAMLPLTQLAVARSCSAPWSRSSRIVAAADYLFQYRQWYERQKMSLRELKEEFKQTEGDPTIKGKIRQLRTARMRKRMMAAVPKASVVITNPTHFAVALQYERGMNAPVCVAKGVDHIALQDPRGRGRARRFRSSRTRRSPARCTPPSRSTRKSRPSTTRRWPRSSATSCSCNRALRQAVDRGGRGRNPSCGDGRSREPLAPTRGC